jgi:hypothetical protein
MVVHIKRKDSKEGKAKAAFDSGLHVVGKLQVKAAVRPPL